MIEKRGMNYRGTGSLEEVHTLINEKLIMGHFRKTVLFLAEYNKVLKCHLGNITKKSLKKETGEHNRANRNTFVPKPFHLTLFRGNRRNKAEMKPNWIIKRKAEFSLAEKVSQ